MYSLFHNLVHLVGPMFNEENFASPSPRILYLCIVPHSVVQYKNVSTQVIHYSDDTALEQPPSFHGQHIVRSSQ